MAFMDILDAGSAGLFEWAGMALSVVRIQIGQGAWTKPSPNSPADMTAGQTLDLPLNQDKQTCQGQGSGVADAEIPTSWSVHWPEICASFGRWSEGVHHGSLYDVREPGEVWIEEGDCGFREDGYGLGVYWRISLILIDMGSAQEPLRVTC